MSSREITVLHPKLIPVYYDFAASMDKAGVKYKITSTARDITEQMALFVQGRLPIEVVNRFRSIVGLYALQKDSENKIVTWTLNSKHVTNYFDKNFDNNYSRAFDIVLFKSGRVHWDIKVDVNDNEIHDYLEAGLIGESVGLVWGGRFSKPDYVHFQMKEEV